MESYYFLSELDRGPQMGRSKVSRHRATLLPWYTLYTLLILTHRGGSRLHIVYNECMHEDPALGDRQVAVGLQLS